AAPRPVHGLVHAGGGVVGRAQALDHQLDLLRALAVRHQHGVGGIDDHQVADADRSDHARVGLDVAVRALDHDGLDAHAVAVAVGFGFEVAHRLPRADVAPDERRRHHRDLGCAFHDRVVDGNVRLCEERVARVLDRTVVAGRVRVAGFGGV